MDVSLPGQPGLSFSSSSIHKCGPTGSVSFIPITINQANLIYPRFLGGPIRLAILPGLLIGIVDMIEQGFIYPMIPSFITPISKPFFVMPFFAYMLAFLFGFTMGATDEDFTKTIMKKHRWSYFIIGILFCLLHAIIKLPGIDKGEAGFTTNSIMIKIFSGIFRGLGEWLFIIGSVALAREKFTTSSDRLKILREMAMPFYLIHLQVQTVYMLGALRVPYLKNIPFTVLTTLLSFLITKSGFLRYFFGLPPPKDSFLPGKTLRGFVPTIIMTSLVITHIIIVHNYW